MKTNKFVLTGIVLMFLLISSVSSSMSILPGGSDSNLNEVTLKENIQESFIYCDYTNPGNLILTLNNLSTQSEGNEMVAGDEVHVDFSIENAGDTYIKDISIDYCVFDGESCIFSGSKTGKIYLGAKAKTQAYFDFVLDDSIFTEANDYTLFVKATGSFEEDTKSCVSDSQSVQIKINEPEHLKGDINGDGKRNIFDITFLIDFIYKNGPAPNPESLADFDGNGEYTINDISKLTQYFVEEGFILVGDINTDGKQNIDDVYFLINFIYKAGPAPNPEFLADFYHDGKYDLVDITSLIKYFLEIGVLHTEQNAPVITTFEPDDGETFRTSDDNKHIDFEFMIEDESPLKYCELIVDGKVLERIENPVAGQRLTITKELELGSYDWRIKCVDLFDNVGYSELKDFRIKESTTSDRNVRHVNPIEEPPTKEIKNPIFFEEPAVELTPKESENKTIDIFVKYLIPIFLVLCIILVVVIMLIVSARKNTQHSHPQSQYTA